MSSVRNKLIFRGFGWGILFNFLNSLWVVEEIGCVELVMVEVKYDIDVRDIRGDVKLVRLIWFLVGINFICFRFGYVWIMLSGC